ncbi:MAG: galactose mutarotase [Spirochaetales bacterium]|nr:galactose mutarotase [Spirochaetales bacterium]
MEVSTQPFGTFTDSPISVYTLRGSKGFQVQVTNLGACLVSVQTTVKGGSIPRELCLGFDNAEDYGQNPSAFGMTVGPVANRISNASFTLNGKTYELEANNGEACLHSGRGANFGLKVFSGSVYQYEGGSGVVFTYRRPDGEGGFPGNLEVESSYWLTEDDQLILHYKVTTDAPTPVAMTNHGYWNLKGEGSGLVHDHEVQILADSYLAVDDGLIPTGDIVSVTADGGVMDFRGSKPLGQDIDDTDSGYDHCYILQSNTTSWSPDFGTQTLPEPLAQALGTTKGVRLAARVVVPDLAMEVYTDMPAVQFYSANMLKGVIGRRGMAHTPRTALCLETGGYNNAINIPSFPTWVLNPGQEYRRTTVHRFV